MSDFDYIVCGGGSAGCVLAAELARDPARRVLVIESGRRDRNPWIHIPATFFRVLRGGRDAVTYASQPEPGLGGRPCLVPQGHVLGGGSSVNAMIYIRGQAQDYDDWAAMGCEGWDWAQVLPVFRALEGNRVHGAPFHGRKGALTVSNPRHRHPLSEAFLAACQQAGLPASNDFNGAEQAGTGFYQTTTRDGRRCSAARAFLHPALKACDITLMTGARIDRVIIENARATGVRLADGRQFTARHEVIVCAGALATPLILMRSGLGPAAVLEAQGVPVLADLPGVGRNYQDHMAVPVEAETRAAISTHGQDRGLRAAGHMLRYLASRRGLLASNIVEAGGFVDTAGTGRPDIQFHMIPGFAGAPNTPPIDGHGISFSVCALRPAARGHLALASRDPLAQGRLQAGVLDHPQDIATTLRGLRLALSLLERPALKTILGPRRQPAPGADDEAALRAHIRASAKTVYHPAGTARMGHADDPEAVLDARLRLRGIRGLRVADASVMPVIVSGNTNAPCMMIGARAAQFITDEEPA
ncbi:MAG: GMC family oxidoreductase [Pararhodobacter sp.]